MYSDVTAVLCTGGYDPIHSGHIAYFQEAAKLGDMLIVGVNSDEWLVRKKGRAFMPWSERSVIIQSLRSVNITIGFDDATDDACDAIARVLDTYKGISLIFANGGDRSEKETPEYVKYKDHPLVTFKFNVGGSNKANSSSWILEEWKSPKTIRPWGWYRVLDEQNGAKVKELVVEPNKSLSMQRHHYRNELWFITEGACIVDNGVDYLELISKYDNKIIPIDGWHKLINPFDVQCRIIEIQYGEQCVEEDIERKLV